MNVELYSGAGFFLVAAALCVPAIVLGIMERSIKHYGIVASVIMLLLVMKDSWVSILLLCSYMCYQVLLIKSLLYLKHRERTDAKINRIFVALAIMPLIASKLISYFDIGTLGFIGLSYMTFKSVQVLIEICDGLIKEVRITDYLYFTTFFPTVLCGPIDRSRRFLADSEREISRAEYLELLGDGLYRISIGAVYKFVFANLCMLAGTDNMYVYGFYMFFDFAGYSMMAIGLGQVFGIQTPENFRNPWKSIDMRDFWNRWHITLSTWLRDFLFSRILKNSMRAKLFGGDRVYQACFCLVINMFVMGLWHGLEANYIIYGLYHGALLAVTELYQKKSKFYKKYRNNRIYRFLSWFVTFNLVMVGFGIFSGDIF